MQMVNVTTLEGDGQRGRAEPLMAHTTPYLAASSQNDLSFIPCIYTLTVYTHWNKSRWWPLTCAGFNGLHAYSLAHQVVLVESGSISGDVHGVGGVPGPDVSHLCLGVGV